MQYIIPAFVALAIGANAAPAPHWEYPRGFGGPLATGGACSPGLIPTGTGLFPSPTSPPYYSKDEDGEAESTKTKSAKSTKTKSAKSTKTKSAKSTKTKSAKSSSTEATGTEATSAEATSTEATSTEATSGASSTGASTATASSAPAITPSPPSTGGGGSSGGSLPAASGSSVLSAVQTIAAGQSFDGGMVAYDRGVDCSGQAEGGDSDAVFYLEPGASLSNVIIGPNQIEGVHCYGECTLTNVWWAAVCEDALTVKEQEAGATTTINGGGAFGAEDKVLQHNGGGTISVSDFTVDTFGKLYRSCGNCKTMYERHVIFNDITATDGGSLAGINTNYGDTATFAGVSASGVKDICVEYKGNDSGDEPEKLTSGPSQSCVYTASDVTST